MKKVDSDVIFMLMGTFILEILLKIKSTVRGLFIGLAFMKSQKKKNFNNSSNIMDNGGVDYLMEKANISKQMVFLL